MKHKGGYTAALFAWVNIPPFVEIVGWGYVVKERRTLCGRCMNDYKTAGYRVYIMSYIREPYDKCGRMGFDCKIKRGGERWRMKKI
ncbi:MAG: hypothetical protein J6C82_04985 [Clostridia bacterium]|nr:hypothetical protein [Clostridia bacterium]